MGAAGGQFRVAVTKDYLVFAAAHFITFPGHRCEPLHGHNYRVRVVVEGPLDGESFYVVDFAVLKKLMTRLIGELDHKVLLPLENPKLTIGALDDAVTVAHQGKPRYVFPKAECALLPIPNTTVEVLARYLGGQVRAELASAGGGGGGGPVQLTAVELEVEENFGQSATYREAFG